jgi:hypothetical protein
MFNFLIYRGEPGYRNKVLLLFLELGLLSTIFVEN